MADPDQVLANYEGTLAEAQRRSDAIRETLASLQVTERSADGQISVTVNDAGNLVDLTLPDDPQRGPRHRRRPDLRGRRQAGQHLHSLGSRDGRVRRQPVPVSTVHRGRDLVADDDYRRRKA